jgi:ribosomal-protein-alanine N-acetyltransferase
MRFLTFGKDEVSALRLESTRTYLRLAQRSDWRAWVELRKQSREFLTPWEPLWRDNALSRAQFLRRVRVQRAEARAGNGFGFLLFRTSDERLLGGITISNVRRGVAQSASLGYWIGAVHTRKGYMTEALDRLLTFSFLDLGLNRVEAACLPHNDASKALLLKAGFRQEGLARSYLRINGAWQDHLLFAILANEHGNKSDRASHLSKQMI